MALNTHLSNASHVYTATCSPIVSYYLPTTAKGSGRGETADKGSGSSTLEKLEPFTEICGYTRRACRLHATQSVDVADVIHILYTAAL